MNDTSIGGFLAARRKAIAGLLGFAGVLIAGGIVPDQVALAVQGVIAFLGIYGIHEVANDQPVVEPPAPLVLAPTSYSASGADLHEAP